MLLFLVHSHLIHVKNNPFFSISIIWGKFNPYIYPSHIPLFFKFQKFTILFSQLFFPISRSKLVHSPMIQNSLFRFNRNHLKPSSINFNMANHKGYPLKSTILIGSHNREQKINQNLSLFWLPKYHPLIPLTGFIISLVSYIIGIYKGVRNLPIDLPFIISSIMGIAFQLLSILIFHCFNFNSTIQTCRSLHTFRCNPILISYIGFIISTLVFLFQLFLKFPTPADDGDKFVSYMVFCALFSLYYFIMIIICICVLIDNHSQSLNQPPYEEEKV
jgi:hypothetical protein